MQPDVPDCGRGIGPHFALHVPTGGFLDFVEDRAARRSRSWWSPTSGTLTGVWAAFCKDPDGNIIELTDMGPHEERSLDGIAVASPRPSLPCRARPRRPRTA